MFFAPWQRCARHAHEFKKACAPLPLRATETLFGARQKTFLKTPAHEKKSITIGHPLAGRAPISLLSLLDLASRTKAMIERTHRHKWTKSIGVGFPQVDLPANDLFAVEFGRSNQPKQS